MPFAESLDTFFADFGDDATWGVLTEKVLLDTPTEDILGGRALSVEFRITMQAAGFPAIARGANVTIGAVTYVVREVRLVGDGKLKELLVGKA